MNTGAEKNIDQLAKDVHFLASPFRLIWNGIIIFVLLFLSPLIFAAIFFGLILDQNFGLAIRHWLLSRGWFPPITAYEFGNPLTADDVLLLKILLGVFGPFAFAFWFAIVTRWREVRRNGSHDGVLWANVRGMVGLGMSFAGVLASLSFCAYLDIEGEASLLVMAIGVMSPALLWFVLGLVRELIWRREQHGWSQAAKDDSKPC